MRPNDCLAHLWLHRLLQASQPWYLGLLAKSHALFSTIQHKEALWHYDGMRVILAKMAKDLPNGGFFWIRPWELLSNEDSHEDVSRKITSNITS